MESWSPYSRKLELFKGCLCACDSLTYRSRERGVEKITVVEKYV
jgi:hypothetical protein